MTDLLSDLPEMEKAIARFPEMSRYDLGDFSEAVLGLSGVLEVGHPDSDILLDL